MQTRERKANYAAGRVSKQRRRVRVRVRKGQPMYEDGLTSAQRRRVRHKDLSAKTHDHSGRVLVEVAPGKFKKSPCPRCSPLPRMRFGGAVGKDS